MVLLLIAAAAVGDAANRKQQQQQQQQLRQQERQLEVDLKKLLKFGSVIAPETLAISAAAWVHPKP